MLKGKGWEYDNNGMINVTNDNTADVKDYLDCNALFFAPGNYISSTYNLPSQGLRRLNTVIYMRRPVLYRSTLISI